MWMDKIRNDYDFNRMKSARIAEKYIIDLKNEIDWRRQTQMLLKQE